MLLLNHREHKERVIEQLGALATIAADLGMNSLQVDIVGARLPKLAEERFNLVVLGEFNHGKSTFVNALLGESLLPVGITPTTATINHIVFADDPKARAILDDGSTKEIDPAALADYVTLEGEHRQGIRYVELGYPVELLRERITLVDTPGVNDINEARAEITYGYIPRADAVLFLLDGTQVLKKSERAFLQQRLLRHSRDKLIFIVGKADLLTAAELQQALAFAREHLSAIIDDPTIFALSPRQYLEGEQAESKMAPLLEHLQRYLNEERARILVDNAISDASRTAGYLRSSVGLKRGALELSLEELSARVVEVRGELEGSKQTIRQTLERIRTEGEAIKATIRHDLRQFVEAFVAALPKEIDQADANDVKRFLQYFIQDRFKDWAEEEGDKIAALLENLAEEIIQVTNENVHTVLDAVATHLGPADTKINLEVDTLKYDAGVFAVGALGTTVFLFVNAFVGGLLTLAAPILAVVLREKVGARIKAQAKENAPAVIERAAETIAPRFQSVVDQFADRLSDFVSAAGEALHRGISEILDRALAEREAHSEDAETLTADLQQKEAALDRIDETLLALREQLWASGGDEHASAEALKGDGEA